MTNHLTRKILIAMATGISLGILLHALPNDSLFKPHWITALFSIGGKLFIRALKMLVVPVVFVSLMNGTCALKDSKKFGRIAIKTVLLYLLTTALAITIALVIADFVRVGAGSQLPTPQATASQTLPTLSHTLIHIMPANPIEAMAQGNMLQIIIFAILVGLAIAWAGSKAKPVADFVAALDAVIMQLVSIVISVAPLGVFFLVTDIFNRVGFGLIWQLIGYFSTVVLALFLQLLVTYSLLLRLWGRQNPIEFFKSMASAMLFAFAASSSNAAIPVVMNSVKQKLGVPEWIAAFIIPLGATINMDGTAIMQGVATVFIANAYHINIGLTGYLMVVLTATLASIGTAGVPSVGLITLTMVLQQVGLPVEGIALIIGVDRLLDMTRTMVNVTGDATIAVVLARQDARITAPKDEG